MPEHGITYIGARYVPKFADPILHDPETSYEPLTIVTDNSGASYTSKRAVPIGIALSNQAYWVRTGNYNAQVENYARAVEHLENTIVEDIRDDIEELQTEAAARDDRLDLMDSRISMNMEDVSYLKRRADTIESDIEDLQSKDEVIWIGDSWSIESRNVPQRVASSLNCTLHSYAVAGAGWTTDNTGGTSIFSQQLANAIADDSVNPNNVRYVIFAGGSNDFKLGNVGTMFNNAVISLANDAKAAFPRAKVHVFFTPRFKYGSTRYHKLNPQIAAYNRASNALNDAGAGLAHPESTCWCLSDTYWDADLIHLTDAGYLRWANYILASIEGIAIPGNTLNVKRIELESTDGNATGAVYFYATNTRIMADVYINSTNVTSNIRGMGTSQYMFPVEMFNDSDVDYKANQLSVAMGENDNKGLGHAVIQFNRYDTHADIVWFVPPADGSELPAGHYSGHGEYRISGVY